MVREPNFAWERQRTQRPALTEVQPSWPLNEGPRYTVLVASLDGTPSEELLRSVEQEGLAYRVVQGDDLASGAAGPQGEVHAVLLDLTQSGVATPGPAAEAGLGIDCPRIAVLAQHQLGQDVLVATDDFIVCPWAPGELAMRIRRLAEPRPKPAAPDAPGVIRVGDLVIDTNRYDVFVAGRPVLLTFKEYELLKLLASHPRRVFTREALLEQVWGYEYFGGTRTVDVHVRRLRSKTDDTTHTFIDTVWNVGYRFRT